jgi:hypothetical protein
VRSKVTLKNASYDPVYTICLYTYTGLTESLVQLRDREQLPFYFKDKHASDITVHDILLARNQAYIVADFLSTLAQLRPVVTIAYYNSSHSIMTSTDANAKPWTGPGIMVSFAKLKKNSKLSQETLDKWWKEVYLPKILETGLVESEWTWKAADPNYKHQQMILYKMRDLAPVQAGGLKADKIPRTSDMFPTDGPVDDFVDYESRIYSLVQLYETEKQPKGRCSCAWDMIRS